MTERTGIVTVGGNPVTILGDEVKVGDKAPNFEAVGNDMQAVKLSDFSGKVVILVVVHSLETSVCDMETRRFNSEAATLGEGIAILTVSMDLPFAQKRWCGAAGIDQVQTVSDYRTAEFGGKYGVLIKELRLHARATFVVDQEGIVRYAEVLSEVGHEPDYDAALSAARELV